MTIITRLPYVSPDAAALTPIDLTDDEIEIYQSGVIKAWYRAADGYSDQGLQDRMELSSILAPRALLPQVQTLPAYNSKKAVVFGTGANNGDLSAVGTLPINQSCSVIIVGRAGPTDNAYLWGNAQTGIGPGVGTYLQHASDGSFSWQFAGAAAAANSGAYKRPNSAGPNIITTSWDQTDASRSATMRINRGAYSATLTGFSGVSNAESTLRVGAAGPASAGSVDAGDLEIIVLNTPLNRPENYALRDLIEGYLGARYGIVAP